MSKWRDVCRPIIAQVLKDTQGKPEQDIRRALRDAYPFNERKMWPYKVWLSEIALQRGKAKRAWKKNSPDPDPAQEKLL
jgi:adenine-specific DNA glycosylase